MARRLPDEKMSFLGKFYDENKDAIKENTKLREEVAARRESLTRAAKGEEGQAEAAAGHADWQGGEEDYQII